MDISPELAQTLETRFTHFVYAENSGDVEALYSFIDPQLREKREREHEFEPEHTIAGIQEHVVRVQSATIDSFSIEKFTTDGGRTRNHRPTAIVISRVIYNGTQPSNFRTPWVLDGDIWYTRALGRMKGFSH